MNNLKEIHDKNRETTHNFVYSTDNRGVHVYRIHLMDGAEEFSIEEGIQNLRKAIEEQNNKQNNKLFKR
jgi:hypothetical protein